MQNNPADFSLLAYAFHKPELSAVLKHSPEDFIVDEIGNTELSGEGEHLWCWVEKRQQNTDWVAGQLAIWAQTSKKNIGFAGQKDRHAITRQWFSIHLPGKANPAVEELDIEGVKILRQIRHHKKLQRGDLSGNSFRITLRNIQPANAAEIKSHTELQTYIEQRLNQIKTHGFPNYFGEQRFGRQGNNLMEAEKLFALSADRQAMRQRKRGRNQSQRNKHGLYISAARSWMFNELLSERIRLQNWQQCISGELLLVDNECCPLVSLMDDEKLKTADLANKTDLTTIAHQAGWQPAGTLFGDAALLTQEDALELEQAVQKKYSAWMTGLQNMRVQPGCRTLRVIPQDLQWQWCLPQENTSHEHNEPQSQQGVTPTSVMESSNNSNLVISFSLPAGSFATSLLRELVLI